jgi:hypothetical protein
MYPAPGNWRAVSAAGCVRGGGRAGNSLVRWYREGRRDSNPYRRTVSQVHRFAAIPLLASHLYTLIAFNRPAQLRTADFDAGRLRPAGLVRPCHGCTV